MRIITATFIGKDGSMGYRTGETYKLRYKEKENRWGKISIEAVEPFHLGSWCPYKDRTEFKKNWKEV